MVEVDALLSRVTLALRLDQSTAPAAMLEAVQERLGLPVPLHPLMNHAEVATVVQRYRNLWQAVFFSHLSDGVSS